MNQLSILQYSSTQQLTSDTNTYIIKPPNTATITLPETLAAGKKIDIFLCGNTIQGKVILVGNSYPITVNNTTYNTGNIASISGPLVSTNSTRVSIVYISANYYMLQY
jgi:hypothetical protein